MARPPRLDFPGARHHVFNRGARRQAVFLDDATCADFLALLADLDGRFGVIVNGYALMPNHYHLLLRSESGRLSDAMRHVGAGLTAIVNGRHPRWDGPVLRGRFRNRVVETEEYWRHLLAYIHLNPVEAHLVPEEDDARWTSHGAYAGLEPGPDWLETDDLMELFGSADAYREYVRGVRIGRQVAPADFDSDALFLAPRTGSVPRRPVVVTGRMDAESALEQVARVTGRPVESLHRSVQGRRGNPARWVAAWWLERVSGLPRVEIGALLGGGSADVYRWIRALAEAGPEVQAWRRALRESVK